MNKGIFLNILSGQEKIKPMYSFDYSWLCIIHIPFLLRCRDSHVGSMPGNPAGANSRSPAAPACRPPLEKSW